MSYLCCVDITISMVFNRKSISTRHKYKS